MSDSDSDTISLASRDVKYDSQSEWELDVYGVSGAEDHPSSKIR